MGTHPIFESDFDCRRPRLCGTRTPLSSLFLAVIVQVYSEQVVHRLTFTRSNTWEMTSGRQHGPRVAQWHWRATRATFSTTRASLSCSEISTDACSMSCGSRRLRRKL